MLASFEHTSMCWRKRIAPSKCSIRRWAQRFPANAKMSVSPRPRARLCQKVVVRLGETPFFLWAPGDQPRTNPGFLAAARPALKGVASNPGLPAFCTPHHITPHYNILHSDTLHYNTLHAYAFKHMFSSRALSPPQTYQRQSRTPITSHGVGTCLGEVSCVMPCAAKTHGLRLPLKFSWG